MKRMILSLCMFVVVFSVIFQGLATADVVTIDTTALGEYEVGELAKIKKKAEEGVAATTVDDVEKWAQIGEKVSVAIASAAKELSVEVNDFVKTPVGMIATGLIIYEVIGEDMIELFGGSLAWALISLIVFWSFRHFHMNERVVIDGKKSYVARYDFRDDENKIFSVIAHVAVFVVFTIICLAIIF